MVSRDKSGNADLALKYQDHKFYNLDGSQYKQAPLTGLSNKVLYTLNKVRKSVSYLEKIVSTLETSKSTHFIEFYNDIDGSKVIGNEESRDPKSSRMLLKYDDLSKPNKSGEETNLGSTMAHELSHQYDRDIGNRNNNVPKEDQRTERDPNEIRAVNIENRYRVNNNMILRTHYGGKIEAEKLADPKKAKQ